MQYYCEWIDGYTERVHRKKQHARSIRYDSVKKYRLYSGFLSRLE